MPWYNGNYPPSYENQPAALRERRLKLPINYWNREWMKVLQLQPA
ncbi:MAG TPA: hypothetical protein VFE04_10010 [Puia sp.]|nr:hypothetical protein [Puia sp.]